MLSAASNFLENFKKHSLSQHHCTQNYIEFLFQVINLGWRVNILAVISLRLTIDFFFSFYQQHVSTPAFLFLLTTKTIKRLF